jgi:hypothetical protein
MQTPSRPAEDLAMLDEREPSPSLPADPSNNDEAAAAPATATYSTAIDEPPVAIEADTAGLSAPALVGGVINEGTPAVSGDAVSTSTAVTPSEPVTAPEPGPLGASADSDAAPAPPVESSAIAVEGDTVAQPPAQASDPVADEVATAVAEQPASEETFVAHPDSLSGNSTSDDVALPVAAAAEPEIAGDGDGDGEPEAAAVTTQAAASASGSTGGKSNASKRKQKKK